MIVTIVLTLTGIIGLIILMKDLKRQKDESDAEFQKRQLSFNMAGFVTTIISILGLLINSIIWINGLVDKSILV